MKQILTASIVTLGLVTCTAMAQTQGRPHPTTPHHKQMHTDMMGGDMGMDTDMMNGGNMMNWQSEQ